jgi:ribosomal protein S18 acetylase RimI-like enzyme
VTNVAVIRNLAPSDASAFRTLRLAALHAHPTSFSASYDKEAAQPVAETEHRLAIREGSAVIGAFVNDTLVGSIGVNRETTLKHAHKASLWGMFVAAEYRSSGMGRKLLIEALSIAQSFSGVRQVTLYVNAVNASAVALYESLGFVTYGVEPCGMQVDGVFYDEHLMVRMLLDDTEIDAATQIADDDHSLSGLRALPGLTLAQSELAQLMSDISEDQYCAFWLSGLEYQLWALLHHDDAEKNIAFGKTHSRDVRRLRQLSSVVGGWIVWSDDGEPYRKFVPICEWEAQYARHQFEQQPTLSS